MKTYYVLFNNSKVRGEPDYHFGTIQAKTKAEAKIKAREIFPTVTRVYGMRAMNTLKSLDVGQLWGYESHILPIYLYEAIQELKVK